MNYKRNQIMEHVPDHVCMMWTVSRSNRVEFVWCWRGSSWKYGNTGGGEP